MIDGGANPHIVEYSGVNQYDIYSLSKLNGAKAMPKSVNFLIKKISPAVPGEPWRTTNGVFPATFTDRIGAGGEGAVVGGELNGVKVAFKFVRIGTIQHKQNVDDGLADLDSRLSEMETMSKAAGSSVLKLLGHYRLEYFFKYKLVK